MKTALATACQPLHPPSLLCSFAFILLTVNSILAAPLARATPPLPRNGLVMHLESNVGVQTDNGKVDYWWDQSGYGQNLQAIGDVRLVDNALGGLPIIELDALTDSLEQFRPSTLPTHGNDRTVFVLSAPANVSAAIGYGASHCGGRFLLQHERDGYSGMSTGCADSLMHAQGQLVSGLWRLNTLVISSGTQFHLRDGELVDGRSRNIDTATGPFHIELNEIPNAGPIAVDKNQRLQIAAVLVYNWALGPSELRKVHEYLGLTYFNNANRFGLPPSLSATQLPAPKITLTKTSISKEELQLDWRASFANECGTDTGWTKSRATSGSQRIHNPSLNNGAHYAMYCWHPRASASAEVTLDLRQVQITWLSNEIDTAHAGYRLFIGEDSKRYTQFVTLAKNPSNSHTLHLTPNTYYIAMSTLGIDGRESSLSGEIAVTVR